jgi:hypothetical protein
MGIPLVPAQIAQGIADRVKEHAAIRARLEEQVSPEERADLKLRARHLASEVALWASRLPDHKAFQFKELFADLYRSNPTFKYEAAAYLAALPEDGGLDVLLEGLNGAGIHARSASARALEPHLAERKELPDGLRAALRKALSDDLSGVDADKARYGPGDRSARELAVALRSVAVRFLVRAGDAESIPLLLDLETGKDGVGWTTNDLAVFDDLYRLLAKRPPPLLAERLTAIVDAHLAAEARPGVELPGNPVAAALLLAALGRGTKLEEMRERTHGDFVQAAGIGEADALDEAESLLELRDARAADWLLNRLISPSEQVRGRALAILGAATGQMLVPGVELQGSGSAEDQARWAQARQKWAEWWTAHRQEFQLGNPYR